MLRARQLQQVLCQESQGLTACILLTASRSGQRFSVDPAKRRGELPYGRETLRGLRPRLRGRDIGRVLLQASPSITRSGGGEETTRSVARISRDLAVMVHDLGPEAVIERQSMVGREARGLPRQEELEPWRHGEQPAEFAGSGAMAVILDRDLQEVGPEHDGSVVVAGHVAGNGLDDGVRPAGSG